MLPSESGNSIAIGSEKSNLVEIEDKAFKLAIVNMFKDLKGEINKCLNEDHENRNG